MSLNRDQFRKIKGMGKEEMEQWLTYQRNVIVQMLRKEFKHDLRIELQSSIDSIMTAVVYTLHFCEETKFGQEQLTSFMEDLLVTIDYFRTGEYKAEDYAEQLSREGIEIARYDYSAVYRKRLKELEEEFQNEQKINTAPISGEVENDG